MAAKNGQVLSILRHRLAQMIGAPCPDNMVLTSGATESLNIATLGLFNQSSVGEKLKVVTTQLEHNAVSRPLAALRDKKLIELVVIASNEDGFVDESSLQAALDDRTALVACTHASNVIGTIQPISRICRMARDLAPNALTLVDASQTIGLLPLDVATDEIDLLAFSGHKTLLGPAGTGVLYISDRAAGDADGRPHRSLSPICHGGTGDDSRSEQMPKALPSRFEPGTPNTVGLVGLLAALESRDSHSESNSLDLERSHCARLIDHLKSVRQARVLGSTEMDDRVGVVSFAIEGWDAADLAAALDSAFGICVRSGLHCAPGTHEAMGTLDSGGTVRISPGPFTTETEIDLLLEAIDQLTAD